MNLFKRLMKNATRTSALATALVMSFATMAAVSPVAVELAGPSPEEGGETGALFHNVATLKLGGYAGKETLTNFPVLVRLNEREVEWFSCGSVGRDGFRFTDADGNFLPFEIDTWSERDSSYVWVQVPELPEGGTEIKLYWSACDGVTIPENDPKAVWSRYLLVLHGNASLDNAASADMGVRLPYTEKYGATLIRDRVTGEMINGVIGGGFQKPVKLSYGVNFKNPVAGNLLTDTEKYTLSGWFNHPTISNGQFMLFGSAKSLQTTEGGFLCFAEPFSDWQVLLRAGQDKQFSLFDKHASPPDSWNYHAFSYDGSAVAAGGNPVEILVANLQKTTQTSRNFAINDAGLTEWAFGAYATLEGNGQNFEGWFDELRVFDGAASLDWMQAEYAQIGTEDFYTVDHTLIDGKYRNRWVREPSLPATVIRAGEPVFAESEIDHGEATYGTAKHAVYAHTESGLVEVEVTGGQMPSAAGTYDVLIMIDSGVAGGIEYNGMTNTLTYAVIEPTPYTDLGTAEGRVMLAGDVDAPQHVGGEAYYLTSESSPTFWTHEGQCTERDGNLLPYENHAFWTMGFSSKLWQFQDVRIGNTLPETGSGVEGLVDTQVYLPWSEPILRNSRSTIRPERVDRSEVAHMVMRNRDTAAIYSSCFTNGIGTIYFDAANAWTNTWTIDVGPDDKLGTKDDIRMPNCTIAVYISTNCINNATLPPTDEYVRAFGEDGVEDPYGNAAWHPVKLHVLCRDYPKGTVGEKPFVQLEYEQDGMNGFLDESCTKFNLSIQNGGTAENFYRIYIPLDYMGPVRFKIVRESTYPMYYEDEGYGQILVDNIIASLPHMRAELTCWPQVGENDFGYFDDAKHGKETLGWEAAWMVPFPSAHDEEIYARAKAIYYTNGGETVDVAKFVPMAFMNYRWRYLDQTTGRSEAIYDWQRVELDPNNGFKARTPLNLPNHAGDVEFYFTIISTAPYYSYVDYTGSGLGLGGFYTEEVPIITNRADVAEGGRDWFIRLREGKSDYESLRLVAEMVDEEGEKVEKSVWMELIDDHVWRGYLQTLDPVEGGIRYRFEALNRQTAGSEVWNASTNYWRTLKDAEYLPWEDSVYDAGADDWATVPCDAMTGYLMFQLDDETHALTIVHADYQNFNAWHDAKRNDRLFVGSSTADDEKSGASPRTRDCSENFAGWLDMSATNVYWQEDFTPSTDKSEYDPYEPFTYAQTPNGWTAGPGMWTYGNYRDPRTGQAFQMQGQGIGYVQFVDAAESPRGIENFRFNAHLAQSIGINDFCYYDSDMKRSMTNYTFFSRAVFDPSTGTNFSGNATLSLIARYRPGVGCYEFRFEQVQQDDNGKDVLKDGPKPKGQTLSLYRWKYDKDGRLYETLLGSLSNNLEIPLYNKNGGYIPMYISVSNDYIMAGILRSSNRIGFDPNADLSKLSATNWISIAYRDKAPVDDDDDNVDRLLASGTYGVLAANCPGFFCRPTYLPNPIPLPRPHDEKTSAEMAVGEFRGLTDYVLAFNSAGAVPCDTEIFNDGWHISPGRMAAKGNGTPLWGLRAVVPVQEISVSYAAVGKTDWKELTRLTVDSFGWRPQPFDISLHTTEDCSVRIASVGTSHDMRTDVVIDDIALRQWRGNDWTKGDEMIPLIPNWTSEDDYKAHTNFIFTSAWIKNESLLLSAKRTAPGTPCGIRSPLFDGSYDRGLGLGMMSFAYSNAQENVNLLVQVATNITWSEVNTINNLDDLTWTTVTNFDFSTMSPEERKKGTFGCYIGLHGVKGVMRLLLDPEVVKSVKDETYPDLFGEIYITSVFCRDEPTLDTGCWWGWNLRTLGPVDDEMRMYLPDWDEVLEDQGLSLALNNSTSDEVLPDDPETYRQHVPFLQTPTFVSNVVGEVTFRARKYNSEQYGQPAQVTLYGSLLGTEGSDWVKLHTFIVTNMFYDVYSYKTEPGETYGAFRLAVTGVAGVSDPHMSNPSPEGYSKPVRVLIDEVLVSEAVRARVAFRNVGAFRSDLEGTAWVPDVPSAKEQPLCNESWGVQCEVYAAQLAEEIDFSRAPVVRLYWMEGTEPWGFEKWKNDPTAKSAVLARATGTNLVYRSSYVTAPDAVIPMSTTSGSVVQYGLEVVYYQVGAEKPMTNYLSATDWVRPEWYAPVDYNRDYGKGMSFSAYNILDTVAPYWAWINEVNVYGEYDYNYNNSDADCQYVEIAVPQEADIGGWKIRFLEIDIDNKMIITNTVGVFGSNLPSTKPGLIGAEDNMVFRVLACPSAKTNGTLRVSDGTLDGTWLFDESYIFSRDGEISASDLFAIQLVRASGIVEHEILTRGMDFLAAYPDFADFALPTNTIKFLNETLPGSHFVYVGDDDGGVEMSRGVDNENGRRAEVWNDTMHKTPGRKNEGQVIDPDHPTPNGSSVMIFANLSPVCPHIRQTAGDVVNTNVNTMIMLQKGSERGTNIVYTVDPWYELDVVTTNGQPTTFTVGAEGRTYSVTVGVGASNNVTVVASAKVADAIDALIDDKTYEEAVVDWLTKHKDAFGNDWANPDAEEVKLADIIRYPGGETVTNMTLTQMYWLDMDPTVGGLGFMPAVTGGPDPRVITSEGDTQAATNIRLRVFAMITNRTEDAASDYYGQAWPPYVIRGIEPGSLSWDYTDDVEWSWTSVTFKVTGILANGLTSRYNKRNWIPLRWFVFYPDSFRPADDPTAPFTSDIELTDPYSVNSPAYGADWYDWVKENGFAPIYYFWTIDTRLKPFTVEHLKVENYYNYE